MRSSEHELPPCSYRSELERPLLGMACVLFGSRFFRTPFIQSTFINIDQKKSTHMYISTFHSYNSTYNHTPFHTNRNLNKNSPPLNMESTKTHSTPTPTNCRRVRLALCQMMVTADLDHNLRTARNMCQEAATVSVLKEAHEHDHPYDNVDMIVLPEMFVCPYSNASFPKYAQPLPNVGDVPIADENDHHTKMHKETDIGVALSALARDCRVYLVAGSVPEREITGDESTEKLYNTSMVFDPNGKCIAKHRKVHLFDIDVPGKVRFKESDTLHAGNQITTFETTFGKCGLAICYDVRFAMMATAMAKDGAKILLYPGAFNTVTGEAHWELLMRARAVDNQVFVAACSPARDQHASYHAWGHSCVVDPWGTVLATTGHEPAIVYAEIDLDKIDEVRRNIPITLQTRPDLYQLTSVLEKKTNQEAKGQ